ncbi:hypothetical protein KR222_011068, partial [Zaprionus bogoriensis]
MGANNSKPQTVQMSNTSPFQISREVLERVEKATKPEKGDAPATATATAAGPGSSSSSSCSSSSSSSLDGGTGATAAPTYCENCQRSKSAGVAAVNLNAAPAAAAAGQKEQPVPVSSSWSRRSTEIEEKQFSKTLDRVHNLFGQPVKWVQANNCSADIEAMEKDLIVCYRQYGSEPLKCAPLVKKYHSFVFNKQVDAAQNTATGA